MNFTVYKSSAGSGKTYTLVREYLRLCLATENADSFKSILAITFTNKAAAEMKERVFAALKGISETNSKYDSLINELYTFTGVDEKVLRQRSRKVMNAMLHNYGAVAISTIDKFVYKIVRNFARDLNLPADFEIELDANVLLQQAIELMLAKVGNHEILTNFLYEFTETRAGNEQNWNAEKDLLDFARNLLTDESIVYLNKIKDVSLNDFLNIKNKLTLLSTKTEEKAKSIAVEALQAIEKVNVSSASYAYNGAIIKFFSKLNSNNLADEDFDAIKQVSNIVEKNKHVSAKADASDINAIESIAPTLNQLFHHAIRLIEEELPEYTLYDVIKKNIYPLALLNEINLCLLQIKEEQQQVHISEFNKLIANIVVNEPAPFIYERLGEKYNHFLIDEFQDTSITQFHNMLPLIENSLAEGGFNLLVGDGKQSIYRWRGGEIEQFMKLPLLINKTENILLSEKEKSLERNFLEKNLLKNFRSQKQIIEFNNLFFGYIKQYIPETLQSIYNKHEQEFNPELNKGYVELKMFEVEGLASEDIDATYFNQTEEYIYNCLQQGYQYSDIAIIVRTNKHGSIIAEFLTSKSIPIVSKESLLLKNNVSVQFLVNCFTCLLQPKNQLAKIAIAQFLASKNNTQFIITRENIEVIDALDFDGLFKHFNINLQSSSLFIYPMYDAAECICRSCNLFESNNAYIIYFLDNLLVFAQKVGASFTGFLQWWHDNKNKLSVSVPEGVNAVNILSIHKSKGLEFPVVIVPYANWMTNKGQDYLWLNINLPELLELKTALITTNKKLQKTSYANVYDDEKNKTILDNINMLYVAFTRAEQQLYIIAEKPKGAKNLSKYFVDFINSMNKENDKENTFIHGAIFPLQKQKQKLNNILQIPIISIDWREKISVV